MYPTQGNSTKIKKLPVFSEEKDLQRFLEQNFTESLKQMIKLTVKTMVKEEMEQFRQQTQAKLQFNGYYDRNMLSTFGKIEDIPIPRFRQGVGDMQVKSLAVFATEQEKFMKLVEQMHLLGISQRKVKYLAQQCFGIQLSCDRVGAIHRELAEKEEVNMNQQVLDDDFVYILLDGIWEKTKGYGWDDNKSVLLCALGVRPSGERKILGFSLARHEDTQSWQALVGNIKQRGLSGTHLKLVIMDDNQGAKHAVTQLYPTVPMQCCIVHKMRNCIAKASYKQRTAVIEDVKTIFTKETTEEALATAKAVVKKWYVTEPKAMESLRYNLEDCLTYLQFPKDQWAKIRTTNMLEREFREVRRRMKVFDNTFQNEASANRYANSIFTYLNQNYPLSMKGLHTNA